MSADARERPVLRPLRLGALGYTLFVVYGCLVPFHFTPLPWAAAWARFQQIPNLQLGPALRSDWIANVLLFCLSAFLWIGSIWPGRPGPGAVLRSVAVWVGSVAFVTLLEFAQVYFPPRSVALQDVFAGSVGAAIGIGVWWLSARRVLHHLALWSAVRGREGFAGWLLWPYTVLLVLYDVMPLDLTSSPQVLYKKWLKGMIWLVPFASLHGSLVERVYSLGVEALLWLPLAALLVLSGRAGRLSGWSLTVLIAIGVEVIQLPVQSRVSDVTDVLCAAVGAALGVALGGWLRTRAPEGLAPPGDAKPAEAARAPLLALLGFFAWSAALAAALCYPFDFHFDPSTYGPRVDRLLGVPFQTYWMGSEYYAFVDLLRKLALFAPLGALLAIVWGRVRGPRARRACAVGSVGAVGVVAGLIEAAQVLLPGKVPDSTDALIGAVGGAVGYAVTRAVVRRLAPARTEGAPAAAVSASPEGSAGESTPEDTGAPAHASAAALPVHGTRRTAFGAALPWVLAGAGYALLASACLFASESSRVPYNVREMFTKIPGHLAALLFPAVLFAVFLPPALAARWLARGSWNRNFLYPAMVVTHALVAWAGVRAVVPLESIWDIVGSPVLHWPGDLELIGRFAALFGAASILLTGGTLLAGALGGLEGFGRAFLRWLFVGLPLLLVAHLVVVVWADTDNLTELMAGGGGLASSFWLSAWVLSLAAGGAALAQLLAPGARRGTAVLLAAASVPFAWMAVSLGTAPAIAKYGAVFSALQFLLSSDRAHYAAGSALIARYVAAHAAALAAVAITQAPLWAGGSMAKRK